jgi:hypothetical protein
MPLPRESTAEETAAPVRQPAPARVCATVVAAGSSACPLRSTPAWSGNLPVIIALCEGRVSGTGATPAVKSRPWSARASSAGVGTGTEAPPTRPRWSARKVSRVTSTSRGPSPSPGGGAAGAAGPAGTRVISAGTRAARRRLRRRLRPGGEAASRPAPRASSARAQSSQAAGTRASPGSRPARSGPSPRHRQTAAPVNASSPRPRSTTPRRIPSPPPRQDEAGRRVSPTGRLQHPAAVAAYSQSQISRQSS